MICIHQEILVVFKFGGLVPTDRKNILAVFKFSSGVSGPFIKEHRCLSLEVREQSCEFANLQEIKLAAC